LIKIRNPVPTGQAHTVNVLSIDSS